MKKVISLIIVLLLLVTGCSEKEEGYYLTYNNQDIYLEKEFTLEGYNDSFESDSCAFGEKNITYIFDDIEVETYLDKNDKKIVYAIIFTSEDMKTNEGIKLYDEMNDVINKYGKDYSVDDNVYTYEKGDTQLIFITDNDIIRSIEFRLKDANN